MEGGTHQHGPCQAPGELFSSTAGPNPSGAQGRPLASTPALSSEQLGRGASDPFDLEFLGKCRLCRLCPREVLHLSSGSAKQSRGASLGRARVPLTTVPAASCSSIALLQPELMDHLSPIFPKTK